MMVYVTVFLELENWANEFSHCSGVRVHLSSRALINLSASAEIRARKLERLEQLIAAAKQERHDLSEVFVNFGDGAEISMAKWEAEFYLVSPMGRRSWPE